MQWCTSAHQEIHIVTWYVKCPFSFQVLAALAVSLAPFSAGLGKGYSSPAIASLQGPGANATRRDFQLTDQQASWLASLSFLGKQAYRSTAQISSSFCKLKRYLTLEFTPEHHCYTLNNIVDHAEFFLMVIDTVFNNSR